MEQKKQSKKITFKDEVEFISDNEDDITLPNYKGFDIPDLMDFLAYYIKFQNEKNYRGLLFDSSFYKIEKNLETSINERIANFKYSNPLYMVEDYIDDFESNESGFDDFLVKLGISSFEKKNRAGIKKILSQLKFYPRYILDIGFKTGEIAVTLLSYFKNSTIISISNFGNLDDYYYSKLFIDQKFPNRHILLYGDPFQQIEILNSFQKCELVLVNGQYPYQKMYRFLNGVADYLQNTDRIVINDVSPNNFTGVSNYSCMVKIINSNKLSLCKFTKGCALLKKYNGKKIPNFRKMESYFPIYILSVIVDQLILDIEDAQSDPKNKNLAKDLKENCIKLDSLLDIYLDYNIPLDIDLDQKLRHYLDYGKDYIDKFRLLDYH